MRRMPMNVSRIYLVLMLAVTFTLGLAAAILVYNASERVAKSNQELIEKAFSDLQAVSSYRSELTDHERLAYELYAVIDAERFIPLLAEQRIRVQERFANLPILGSEEDLFQLNSRWEEIVLVVDELVENIGRIEQRQTDWDAARAQLKTISDHRRNIDPLLSHMVDTARLRAQAAERRNRQELTTMSSLVAGCAILILIIAITVAWLLRRLFAAAEVNRSLAEFPARNPMPVVTVDCDGQVRYANPSTMAFVTRALGPGATMDDLVPNEVFTRILQSLEGECRGQLEEVVGECILSYVWCWLPAARIFHVYVRDVTSERVVEDQLRRMAYQDSLTGLMNRNAIADKLADLCQEGQEVCLVLLDIERFHLVPANVGFEMADGILKKFSRDLVAEVIRHTGQEVFVARLDGALFAMCWTSLAPPRVNVQNMNSLMNTLPSIIRDKKAIFHASYRMGMKIGRASDEKEIGLLFRDARAALRVAEKQLSTRCIVHDEKIEEHEQNVLDVEDRLHMAINGNDRGLELHFQAKIDLKDKSIVGAEVLLRWSDPELGELLPDRFIPIAEQSGLILELGRWVSDRALEILGEWQRDPVLSRIKLAINAAPAELMIENYAPRILSRLLKQGVPEDRLEIEVTERALVDTTNVVSIDTLGILRRAGVGVSIDDFGTGYSSLGYLSALHISQIKIDKSFVDKVPPKQGTDLARMIVGLAAELGLECVAEGVEDRAQADYLRGIGCDFAQGYHFARPMPRADFEAFVRDSVRVAEALT